VVGVIGVEVRVGGRVAVDRHLHQLVDVPQAPDLVFQDTPGTVPHLDDLLAVEVVVVDAVEGGRVLDGLLDPPGHAVVAGLHHHRAQLQAAQRHAPGIVRRDLVGLLHRHQPVPRVVAKRVHPVVGDVARRVVAGRAAMRGGEGRGALSGFFWGVRVRG